VAVALDSNAIIGFLDCGDVFHDAADARIRELLAQRVALRASVITYSELLTGGKLGHHDEAVVRGFFDDLLGPLMPIGRDVAERAAELRGERRSLRMPDALILAGADLDPEVELIICSDQIAKGISGRLSCEVEALS